MIDKMQLIQKMGKSKAIEFMTNNRSNQPTAFDKTKGIRARVRFRMCSHFKWVIENYEFRPCAECLDIPLDTKAKDFKPHFNMGLGAYVESRQEEKKLAKSLNYTEAG